MAKDEKMEVPIWRKQNLTIMEAAEYSNIGRDKLYAMLQRRDCPFWLQVGTKKKLIKRKKFDEYMETIDIV